MRITTAAGNEQERANTLESQMTDVKKNFCHINSLTGDYGKKYTYIIDISLYRH
jgi:hypothetical protein